MMPQVCAAMIGTVAFSLLFGVPRKYYPWCGVIGGAGWAVYVLGIDFGNITVGCVIIAFCGHGSGHFPVPGVSCHKPVPGYDFPYIRHIPAGAWRRDLLDRILSCHGPAGTGRAYRVCGG